MRDGVRLAVRVTEATRVLERDADRERDTVRLVDADRDLLDSDPETPQPLSARDSTVHCKYMTRAAYKSQCVRARV